MEPILTRVPFKYAFNLAVYKSTARPSVQDPRSPVLQSPPVPPPRLGAGDLKQGGREARSLQAGPTAKGPETAPQ